MEKHVLVAPLSVAGR